MHDNRRFKPINPIFCALDTNDIEKAKHLGKMLSGHVGGVKIGLEFFTRFGFNGVSAVVGAEKRIPLFLDLKFYDIPNTVAGAVRSAIDLGAYMITVHASGGYDMIKAAVEAAEDQAERFKITKPKIIAVTVLTSMDEHDLQKLGITDDVQSHVLRLGEIAQKAGANGLVCSASELGAIRSHLGNDLTLVTPGIRSITDPLNDQKRVVTPKQAIDDGANYLVIGRPITSAKNPLKAVREILETI